MLDSFEGLWPRQCEEEEEEEALLQGIALSKGESSHLFLRRFRDGISFPNF